MFIKEQIHFQMLQRKKLSWLHWKRGKRLIKSVKWSSSLFCNYSQYLHMYEMLMHRMVSGVENHPCKWAFMLHLLQSVTRSRRKFISFNCTFQDGVNRFIFIYLSSSAAESWTPVHFERLHIVLLFITPVHGLNFPLKVAGGKPYQILMRPL